MNISAQMPIDLSMSTPPDPPLTLQTFARDSQRFLLYGIALIAFPLSGWLRPFYNIPRWDFTLFYSAAHFVNTPAILDPKPLLHFEKINHFGLGLYPYPPSFVWLYLPCTHLPYIAAYFVYAALTIALICALAEYGMQLFGLSRSLSYLLTFAWSPVTAALILGQNSLIGLTLFLGVVWALERRQPLLAGLFAGLLLYKPSYGIYILVWMVFQREWRAMFITALLGLGWYGSGVFATGGNASWPIAWIHLLSTYRLPDAITNQDATIGIAGILERFGLPFSLAITATSLVMLYVLYRVRRFDRKTQLFLLGALIPVLGPHAFSYDAVLTLPALFSLLIHERQHRDMILAGSYLPAAGWLIAHPLHGNIMAVVIMACPLLYFRAVSRSVRIITPTLL